MDRNRDLLSDIPTSLLLVILSFLPFKDAVRTCILSKQWRHMWCDAELNIDFSEKFFVNPDESGENQKAKRQDFINFARRFIANYSQSVAKTLSLGCSEPDGFLEDMENIVKFALSHNVRALSLDFSDPSWREEDANHHDSKFELPLYAYEHGQVVESLKLFSCGFDMLKFTGFSALKGLSLGWIRLTLRSILAVLECCPMLESLSLKKCWNIEYFDVSLTDSRLKSLVLDRCDFVDHLFFIEGPKFKFLKFSGKVGHFHLENQREMVEAQLDFGMQTSFQEFGTFLCDFLRELFAAKILTVCSVLLQIIPTGEEVLGMQTPLNVRHLILNTAMHTYEFCGLKFMLRTCPILETLTINVGPGKIFPNYQAPYRFNRNEFWRSNVAVDRCVARTLKVVNVKGFKGSTNELHMLRCLLRYGNVMEELNICVSNEVGEDGGDREHYMGRAQFVVDFNKASRNLSIWVS